MTSTSDKQYVFGILFAVFMYYVLLYKVNKDFIRQLDIFIY